MVKLGQIASKVKIMRSLMKKISLQINKERIKPFLVIYLILLIVYIIISIYTFKDNSVNYFYNGLGQIVIAGFWLLMGIEHLLLKKKLFSIFCFVLSLMFISLVIQNFNLFIL